MSVIATYHPFGVNPYYHTADGATHAPTIRALLAGQGSRTLEWDMQGVRQYLARHPDGGRTCFRGIHSVPPGQRLLQKCGRVELQAELAIQPHPASLLVLLEESTLAMLEDRRPAAVALSGGLDSALLLALLRRLGRNDIPVFTLATNLPGYCELEATRRTAKALGRNDLKVVEVDAASMVACLPEAIAAAEVPLFNLHPVSRFLLARALRAQGYEVMLTGDGADQVFAGSDPRNYLPIVGALTRAAGLSLRSPFFDPVLAASAPPPTPDKAALRALAVDLLPTEILNRPKTPCYAPELDVSAHWNGPAIASLASALEMPEPSPGTDATATLWTTLGLLARHFD